MFSNPPLILLGLLPAPGQAILSADIDAMYETLYGSNPSDKSKDQIEEERDDEEDDGPTVEEEDDYNNEDDDELSEEEKGDDEDDE
jgi:hypothetical protein